MPLPTFQGHETLSLEERSSIREVYRARDLEGRVAVTIVALARGLSPESAHKDSILEELRLLRALDHPAFPKVLRVSESEVWFSYATPEGTPLSALPERLDFETIRHVLRGLADALAHAHERGVFHGDLTPKNVVLRAGGFVTIENMSSRPRDGDFVPLSGRRLGVAPEVATSGPPTAASDAFSLGMILYELLSGSPPFGDPNDPEFSRRMQKEVPKRLSPTIPRDLAEITMRLLEKKVALRLTDLASLAMRSPASLSPEESPGKSGLANLLENPLIFGIALGSTLLALGLGFFLGRREKSPSGDAFALSSTTPIVREEAMLLRVVASPWADVYVDGVKRETTPFADPVRLTPGKHKVKLVHPAAPPEERVVEGSAGQLVFLDVAMHLSALPASLGSSVAEDDTTP